MDQDICPRCRTVVKIIDGRTRCPRCGVRRNFGILVKAATRPSPTSIAAGMPPTAPAPVEAPPRTYLERLLHRLRDWRYNGEPMSDDALEIRRQRIGWLILAVSMLPYIIGAPLLVVFPLVAYLSITREMPFDNQGDSQILFLLVAVPLLVVAAFICYRINRRGA